MPKRAGGAISCPAASGTAATIDGFTASRAASFVLRYRGNWSARDAEFWSHDPTSSRDASSTTSWSAALILASGRYIVRFDAGRRSYFCSDIVFSFDFNLRPPTPSTSPASSLNSSPLHLYDRRRHRCSYYVLTRNHLAEYSVPCCLPFWGVLQTSVFGCVSIYWDRRTRMHRHNYALSYVLRHSNLLLFCCLAGATGARTRRR